VVVDIESWTRVAALIMAKRHAMDGLSSTSAKVAFTYN
jgi:hypothetical protein